MTTDLVNQTIEGVVIAEWKLYTIVSSYNGKDNFLERENYRGLKLTHQILKIAGRIMGNWISPKVDINEAQLGFMPGCRTTIVIITLGQLQKNYLEKKRRICTLHLYSQFNRMLASRCVSINGTFSDDLLVTTGLHQSSVLSPL